MSPSALAPSLETALRQRTLLADGATGTLLDALLGDAAHERRDLLALERPGIIGEVHESYLRSGADIIKTATFNASARGLLRLATGAKEAEELSRRLNAAAAALARDAADEAARADARPRWVAGSIGPGADAPSLGGPGYAELRASYLPQCLGLIEGGADLALIETVQDSLQCKAALGALEEAGRTLGRRLPFIASATVDARGRLLSGADAEAFAVIVEPFGPLALGLNCSGGPEELESAFATLAAVSSAPLSLMPNAGLPRSSGGRVVWPLEAEAFAERCATLARRHGAAVVGGCCGTGPDHIAALGRALGAEARPSPRPSRSFALASSFSARRRGSGPLVIDERSNATGSAAFKALVKAGDAEAASRFVIGRAKGPVGAVDVSVARPGAQGEAELLSSVIGRAASVAECALSIDTTDAAALRAALPLVGGRPLVNSVNLESEAAAVEAFDLAREYGAAVVCLAMDGEGPARDRDAKLAICRRLYDLALSRGLAPEDLLFDTCTFPVAAGDGSLATSAVETLAAVAGLSAACPGSASVLGVGNSSFGLPKALRPALTARFLSAAAAAGLGAAIVDPAVAGLTPSPELAEAADDLILARGGLEGYGRAIERLLSLAPEARPLAAAPLSDEPGPAGDPESPESPEGPGEALREAVMAGDAASARSLAAGLASGKDRGAAAAAIANAMTELGRRYDAGALALPVVLRSADAAREAFSSLRSSAEAATGPRVVLSTVKGDLHDIGKNLVGMVLAAAGYDVLDLGTDRSPGDIAAAAAGAVAVGVSGLLTRSLAEMVSVARALAAQDSKALLLCGGAAVDPDYVAERIAPERPGLVAYARDPFEAVGLLRSLEGRAPGGEAPRETEAPASTGGRDLTTASASQAQPGLEAPARGSEAPSPVRPLIEGPAFIPPFLGSARLGDLGLRELLAELDGRTVHRARWGYADDEAGKAALDEAIRCLREAGDVAAACRYGFFRVLREGDAVLLSDAAGRTERFGFPRQANGSRLSVADFYALEDVAAAFAVTLGREATDYLGRVKASNDSAAYLRAHGLLAGLAEAAAALAHERIATELLGRGAAVKGKRYSFGFPGCPGVEGNGPLLELLSASEIGLSVTDGHQLDPEFSVTALIIPRVAARYLA